MEKHQVIDGDNKIQTSESFISDDALEGQTSSDGPVLKRSLKSRHLSVRKHALCHLFSPPMATMLLCDNQPLTPFEHV